MEAMRTILFSLGAALLLGAGPQLHASHPIALSDGRTFAGWDGEINLVGRISGGAFAGGYLDRRVPRHEFLASTRSFTDAEDSVVEVLPDDPARVTTEMLLSEMTDLSGMALFPDPAYTCRQFSSYDRASKSPEED
jgi:hypothetical protein